jgi:hypothetical protein
MKKIILFYLAIIFLISCKTSKNQVNLNTFENPPGTLKIADNLYFDQTEIRNIDYLEFLHWTKTVYGIQSIEYTSIYPDTSLWSQLNENYRTLDTNYLTHPIFRKLSVLGVSNQQAVKFAAWRSDRVMEFMLIRDGILKHKILQKGDSPFTIEKYFTGKYDNIKPSHDFQYYPQYMLLDSLENTKTGFKNYCTYKKWGENKNEVSD